MARKPWGHKFDANRWRGLVYRSIAVLVICLCCPACQWLFKQHDPFGPNADCHAPPGINQSEIIAHVNANVGRVRGWRNTSAKMWVKGPGIPPTPGGFSASIAVEGPRNMRIIANKPLTGGPAADLGSNEREFWFWMAGQDQQEVITCNHEDIAYAAGIMPIPLEPDWLMEVLGVIPLDEQEVDYVYERPDRRFVEFHSSRVSPSGEPVTKRVIVDRCHGLIREHALLDSQGQIIARATLSQFKQDPASQGILPTRVELEWPQAEMKLTIQLRDIQFNPPAVPITQWQIPQNMRTRRIGPPDSQSRAPRDIVPASGTAQDGTAQNGTAQEDEFQQPIRSGIDTQ